MYKNLHDFIFNQATLEIDQTGETTPQEEQVAVIALLSSMAHASEDFSSIELNFVMDIMREEFNISQIEAAELLEVAEFMQRERGELDKFLDSINNSFSSAQKERILFLVWKVICADGKADKAEAALASDIRSRLGLTLEQAVRARTLIEKGPKPQQITKEH